MTPLKWRKYLKLVEYDLASEKELEKAIHRYPVSRVDLLENDLRAALELDESTGQQNLYVIKLVPLSWQGQLPNLRIHGSSEIPLIKRFLESFGKNRFVEIWYCQTVIDRSVLSVAGRISFYPSNFPKAQILEQVWWCSPRLIESYGGEFEYPYLRAARCSWGWRYVVEEFFIPGGSDLTPSAQEQEFRASTRLLESRRAGLERFGRFLETRCQRDYSIEYKILGSELSIIDWDTSDDKEVLRGS